MKSSAPEASRLFALLAFTALLALPLPPLLGCAAEHTQAPAPFDPNTPVASSSSPAPSASGVTASTAPSNGASSEPRAQTAAQKRPLEITSQCSSASNYYVGDDPKAGGTGKRTLEPMAILPIERKPDGSQTVWLLDEHFAQLIKVNITRGMKKIEIGRSCRTLDAR